MSVKCWCFTDFDTSDERRQFLAGLVGNGVRYICFGIEHCPDTGRDHLQGYVQFVNRKRLGGAKQLLAGTPHLEPQRGTSDEAREYCRKDGRFHEYGTYTSQGKRSDLDNIRILVRDGASELAIADAHFGSYLRYYQGINRYRTLLYANRPRSDIRIIVYWGATGLGKSRRAMHEFPEAYWKPKGEWWDGYNSEEVVIIDEFYGWMSYDFCLRMCDRYPLITQVKGSSVPFMAKTIVFTSNVPWTEWWRNVSDTSAFARRLQEYGTVVEFTEPWLPPTPPTEPVDSNEAAAASALVEIANPPAATVPPAVGSATPPYVTAAHERWRLRSPPSSMSDGDSPVLMSGSPRLPSGGAGSASAAERLEALLSDSALPSELPSPSCSSLGSDDEW